MYLKYLCQTTKYAKGQSIPNAEMVSSLLIQELPILCQNNEMGQLKEKEIHTPETILFTLI